MRIPRGFCAGRRIAERRNSGEEGRTFQAAAIVSIRPTYIELAKRLKKHGFKGEQKPRLRTS